MFACRPVQVGTLFTPTQSLHIQALHLLSFLLICKLHWCNQCTGLEVSANLRKFPFTARNGVVSRSVQVGALFAQTPCFYFQTFDLLSFIFNYYYYYLTALKLLYVAKGLKYGWYHRHDVIQFSMHAGFAKTLLEYRSFKFANLSCRGHCAKAVELFLCCR